MTCPTCGAENTEGARYCRICGVQLGADGFHEAPTRNFEGAGPAPASVPVAGPESSPFATFNASGSAVLPPHEPQRYVPPSAVPAPGQMAVYPPRTGPAGPVPTNPLDTGPVKRRSRAGAVLAIIGGFVLLVIIALVGLGVYVARHVPVTVVTDEKGNKTVSVPGGPTATVGEGVAPDSIPKPLSEWYYDGAEVKTLVQGAAAGQSGGVMEMWTEDDPESVAEYYREKFAGVKETSEVRSGDGEVAFSSNGANVVIDPSDEKPGTTDIVVVLGGPIIPTPPMAGPKVIVRPDVKAPSVTPGVAPTAPVPPPPPAESSSGRKAPKAGQTSVGP